MTVRTWFRLQRGALWARGDLFQAGIERVASIAVNRMPIPNRLRIGDVWLLRDLTRYETERQIIASIEAELHHIQIITKADLSR